jgi:hypothetical protein
MLITLIKSKKNINFGFSKKDKTRGKIYIAINKNVFKNYPNAYFHKLFFGDFRESNRNEIKLKVPDTIIFKNIIESFKITKTSDPNERNQIIELLNENSIIKYNWKRQVKFIECLNFLSMNYDYVLENLNIPINNRERIYFT